MSQLAQSTLAPPTLSVIVVAYNQPELLHATLSSLKAALVDVKSEILVVDNASPDIIWRDLKKTFPDLRVLHLSQNVGFAGANNLALRMCRGCFALLLNPDTVVAAPAINALLQWMEQHSQTGAAGPRLLQPNGQPQPFSFGAAPTPGYLLRRLAARVRGKFLHDWQSWEPQTVDWVAGTCLIVRRQAWEQVGLLDQRFFLYFEDVDWGLRLRRAGWDVVYLPAIEIMHHGGGSVGQGATVHYDRSLVRWYAKMYGRWASFGVWLALRLYRHAQRAGHRLKQRRTA